MSVRRGTALLVAAALTSACGGTLGPLVTDVHYGRRGQLIVTRCMLDISSGGNMTTYELHDCRKTVSVRPSRTRRHAPTRSAVAPDPLGSGATTMP